MTNSTLGDDEGGGPEIPLSQVYCSLIAMALSVGSGFALHTTKFDFTAYQKYIIPCEMISMSVEVLLCGYLISTGEAEPEKEAQMLAMFCMAVVFLGQNMRIYLLRNYISSFVKMHMMLNVVLVPYCFYLVYQSLDKPLELETHMTVIVTALSARLFMNVFLVIGYFYFDDSEGVENRLFKIDEAIQEEGASTETLSVSQIMSKDELVRRSPKGSFAVESFDTVGSFEGRGSLSVTS